MQSRVFVYRFAALVLLASFLQACSTYSLPGSGQAPVEGQPDYDRTGSSRPATPAEPAPPATPPRTDPVVVAAYQPLVDQAVAARNRGDYEWSLALLERAQRIDPGNPDIYLAMAQTHSARGDTSQARATAQRGLLYCVGALQCDALRRYAR